MSTEIALRGTPFPYKVEKAPKQKNQKDWTAEVIQHWMILSADEFAEDCPLADYSEALERVQTKSPDKDHCDRSGWVRTGTPLGFIEQAAPRAGLQSPDVEVLRNAKMHGVVITAGHVFSQSRSQARFASAKKASSNRVTKRRTTVATTTLKKHVIQITGELLARDRERLQIAWYGGDKFSVPVSDTVGFEAMSTGDWFKAVIVRLSNGDVEQALLIKKTDPPEVMSEEDLAEVYSQIPAANLEPID